MDISNYVNRHKQMEKELEVAVKDVNKVAAPHLLLALKVLNAKEKPMSQIKNNFNQIFGTMYSKYIYDELTGFGEDMVIKNIMWESKNFNKTMTEYDDILKTLFEKELISSHNLKNWVLKLAKSDSDKMIKLVKKIAIEDLSSRKVDRLVNARFRSSLHNIKKLLDAITFSALFLVRDKTMKINKIPLMEWVSILDKQTTTECYHRDGLLYNVKDNSPFEHDMIWKQPGAYHWGCRSFVVPYYE